MPTNLSGCVLWLRSDLGITLNTTNVSAWADQSGAGNNYSQGTAGAQPPYTASSATFNGKPCLSCDGARSLLGGQTPLPGNNSTAITMVTVFATSQAGDSAIDGMRYSSLHYSHDCEGHKLVSHFPDASTTSNNAVNDGNAHIGLTAWDKNISGGNIDQYVDGTIASVIGANATALSANTDIDAVCAEARQGSADFYQYQGKYAERIVYNRKLTATEISQVTAYLKSRYAIP